MPGYIRQLRDSKKDEMYPVTKASAVYINKTDTVDRMLNDLTDAKTEIKFDTNKITTTKASGNIITTVFGDNTINETTVNKEGERIRSKKTTINKDGSISIEVENYDGL